MMILIFSPMITIISARIKRCLGILASCGWAGWVIPTGFSMYAHDAEGRLNA
jgi:hypothetical protein